MPKAVLEKDQHLGIRVSSEEKEMLNSLAKDENLTPSETVRRLILEENERKKQHKKRKK